MTPREEKKKKAIAASTTVGVNVLIFLLMLFASAWKTPGSGPGDYPGIEVNLGYDDQGSGNIEPETPIGDEQLKDTQNAPTETQQEESKEASTETDTKPIESGTLTDPKSDVEIKEEKKEEKPVDKTVVKKPTEKVVDKPAEKKIEEKPKVVDSKAVYKGSTSTTTSTEKGTGKQGTAGNQGDDVGKEGNKGVPGGTSGAAVYKGTPGGGDGGPALDLNGWAWDNIPKPNVPNNESGRVVFEIKVDGSGEIISIKTLERSVSLEAENICRREIEKLTFTKTGTNVPSISTGKITFVVRSN